MRLELSGRARALLRRVPSSNLYSWGELLLLAVLAVQCARLVWGIITPVTPLGDWRPPRPGIAGAPGDILRTVDPFFRLEASNKPTAVTSLQLSLYGIRVNEATGGGSAIIATPDGTQNSYAVGDEIMSGATLKSVAFDHVTIDHGGSLEDLYIDQSKPAAPAEPPPPPGAPATTGAPRVTVQQLNSRGLSFSDLRSGIGFIPRIDKGKITGLVVRPTGDGSIFAKAGLHQGDVITEVMGKPVTGPEDIARTATKLETGGILSLTVERGGSTIPIGINVTPS